MSILGNTNTYDKISSIVSQEEKEKLVGAPGISKNEYYIFTQELNADEEKLGVPVAVFSLTEIVVHKGDNVTIHFINTAEEPDDRHNLHYGRSIQDELRSSRWRKHYN